MLPYSIADLPGRPRPVINKLFLSNGKRRPYAEIAAILDLPIASLGPTRRRALGLLRRDRRVAHLDACPGEVTALDSDVHVGQETPKRGTLNRHQRCCCGMARSRWHMDRGGEARSCLVAESGKGRCVSRYQQSVCWLFLAVGSPRRWGW